MEETLTELLRLPEATQEKIVTSIRQKYHRALYALEPGVLKQELRNLLPCSEEHASHCPQCGDNGLTTQNGCAVCVFCGYSDCGL